MNARHLPYRYLLTALGLIGLAGLLRYWGGPLVNSLPSDYASETGYTAETRFRQTPDGQWQSTPLTAHRIDQTFTTSGDRSIVQGDIHWTTNEGQVTYETSGLYGVDRRTRANVPGFGNLDRGGQFLLPPHVQRTTYQLWDPFYSGPRVAVFDHTETLNGINVYVFQVKVTDLDDTAGYDFLPGVPERYHVTSSGAGTLWVEPTSGMVMDFEDGGVSYFVDASTGARVADMYYWQGRFTPDTRTTQTQLATQLRLRILALEDWLPGGLILVGLAALAAGLRRLRPIHRAAPSAVSLDGAV